MTTLSTIRQFKTKRIRARRVLSSRLSGRLVALIICLLALCGRPADAQTTAPKNLGVSTADFNHDGIPDLLVQAQPQENGLTAPFLTIALGTLPYGTFSSPKALLLPTNCTSLGTGAALFGDIAAGDFNGDGLADLFFSCSLGDSSSKLSAVMLGNGDGTFRAPVTLTSIASTGATLGDFNHDGKLDVVLLAYPNGFGTDGIKTPELIFFGGKGDGTFSEPVLSPLGSTADFSPGTNGQALGTPHAADIDGDGYLDIILGGSISQDGAFVSVSVFGNRKDGTFGLSSQGLRTPDASVRTGSSATYTEILALPANIFQTEKPDLLVPGFGGLGSGGSSTAADSALFLIKNTSSPGSFSLATPIVLASPQMTSAAIGSFTGSAYSDVAIGNGTTISILTNDGTGTLTSSYAGLSLPFTSAPLDGGFVLADANGDGYSDIYAASPADSNAILAQAYIVSGSATATSQPVSLTAGTKAISATWGGNVDFSGSTASGTQMVNLATPVVTLTSNLNPLTGSTVIFSGLVAPPLGTTVIPTGQIILDDGTTELARATLDGTGRYSISITALSPGTHPITATYAGDANFSPVTSAVYSQVVSQGVTNLTWPTPDPIAFGTPLSSTQLDAAATDANGTTIIGTYAYDPEAGTVLAPGIHTLSVTFTPEDAVTFASATKTVSLTVLAGASTTALAVTSGGSAVTSVAAGTVVTLTATSVAGGLPVTPGVVNFCDASAASCTGTHLLGTAQLTRAGVATFRYIPGLGAHTYKAVFAGTTGVTASTSATSPLSVTGTYPTATTIAQTGVVGNYSLTATVVGSGGSAQPTGAVTFLDTNHGNALLATATLGAPKLAFALNAAAPFTVGTSPFGDAGFAQADFNQDGKLDLVFANDNGVNILLGNGDGTFTLAATPPSGTNTGLVAAGDFNGDGLTDVFIASATPVVLLGKGDGTFTLLQGHPQDVGPRAIAVGDFNGDGVLDVSQASSNDGVISVLLGNGDGTFAIAPASTQTGGSLQAMAIGDFNSDGKPDLAVTDDNESNAAANAGNPIVRILLGNGDGTFTSTAAPLTLSGYLDSGLPVVVGDFDGDGNSDLAVASSTGNPNYNVELSLFLGKGDGSFTAAPVIATTESDLPMSIAVADFNGDGKSDLVLADATSVSVRLSNGDGTLSTAVSVTGATTDPDEYALAVGDFNGDGIPDIALQSPDAATGAALLTQKTETATASATAISPVGAGAHAVTANYSGDTGYVASVSPATSLTGLTHTPAITWSPAASTIVYGTALGPQQLNASATGNGGAAIAGTYVYTPAAGTVLGVGTHTLSVVFTPSDTSYVPATATVTITVTRAQPALTWATPASIPYGTPLTSAELNATATGIGGTALPGTFVYTPASGTVLAPGTQKLSVTFTPTDAADYIAATASVNLQVMPLALTSFTPSTARVGDPDKAITLTGSGFVTTSVVLVNGTSIATTFVSSTTLTAVIPAADLVKAVTLAVSVSDPGIAAVSATLPFTVIAASPTITLTGPPTTPPGSQPAVTLTITNPYPVDLTASFNLEFASATTPSVDDPAIQFAEGGRKFTFTVPANSETVPAILIQAGTVAGTITVPLTLTANGVDVTPANLQPVIIVIPKAVPVVSTTTITPSNGQLSVAIHGFSNTREVATATFHFVAAPGATITTPDITAPVTPLFNTWFNSPLSDLYGSTFTYTQIFDVSDDPANIGSVTVTLTNSVGASVPASSQ